ncbi:GerAB/ArcD/ProY family transporter [Ferroacidibacillus organovorans]|uniref:Uncharacterized protein n=1 Tax=Ferroacidibacillus organovorans TaxID=1765683 RepID=A0A853K8Z7_9BACL|nr:GerAB/ArcD/ProY family transporter [Ferroacidibacillus organovorans]KYP80986.1 hypothetical protein AYJ22_09395 [Ferroacidibacillus organovorans]OAG93476.1 hypothetical protein AYW79_10380 [Ferroacidibacillus organovorans]
MEVKKSESITIMQASMLIIISLALPIHVELVPFLLKTAGRDAWMVELVCIPIAIGIWLAIWFIARLCPTRSPIERIPPWTLPLLIALADLYVIISLAQSLDSWESFVGIVFLPGVPPALVVISLVASCVWIARHGLRTIAVTVGFLLPFIMIFGVMNTVGTIPVKQYGLLFPLLEHGLLPIARGVMLPLPIMGEFLMILFFYHQIQGKNALSLAPWMWTLGILAVISVGLVMGILAEYGPYEAAHLRFPAFGGWRLLTFGEYIERLDYFALYQWTVGLAGRIMVLLFITGQVVKNIKIRLPHMIGIASLAVILVLLPIDVHTKVWLRSQYYSIEGGMEVVVFLLLGIGSWFQRSRSSGGIQLE